MKLRFWPKRKRYWPLIIPAYLLIFAGIGLLIAFGPTKLTLTRAALTPSGPPAQPHLLQEGINLQDWQHETLPALAQALQDEVYGHFPQSAKTRVLDKKIITTTAFHNKASVEEYTLQGLAVFNGQSNETPNFKLVVVVPKHAEHTPVPIILMQSFCPNHNTVPVAGVSIPEGLRFSCDEAGIMSRLMRFVFGRYIATPPIEMILDHGYAFAAMYPAEYVPDRRQAGMEALKSLSQGYGDDKTRWGAIAAWAWGFSRAIDALQTDQRFQHNGYITYGHSRYGKSALLAAAFDPRISAVIAHQSGTGGAALNRHKKGETLKDITASFPHWFARSYAGFAGHEDAMHTDQHALLALIAPRPVLLGNAKRDVWSDPNGTFRAAQGASPAYKLYQHTGLAQDDLSSFHPAADIAFWMRPGTHGVTQEDWPAFLKFLDAHFQHAIHAQ